MRSRECFLTVLGNHQEIAVLTPWECSSFLRGIYDCGYCSLRFTSGEWPWILSGVGMYKLTLRCHMCTWVYISITAHWKTDQYSVHILRNWHREQRIHKTSTLRSLASQNIVNLVFSLLLSKKENIGDMNISGSWKLHMKLYHYTCICTHRQNDKEMCKCKWF